MRAVLQFNQAGITNRRPRTASVMLLGIILCAVFNVSQANTKKLPAPTNDVRILIDISGSMKKNDPANLRQPALNLFVSLLADGTQSGVWTFGQWVNMLIPHGTVDKQWKANAKKSAQKINSAGLYTNIEDAIRRSTWDWRNTDPTPGSERSLILLTDGLVDISKNEENNQISRNHVLQELLPLLQKSNVTIHAIALSNESDKKLLEQLTTATGGRFETIETAKGLERLFLHLFENVAPTDTLPLTENRVKVDNSIKEMTFLIFREHLEEEGSITSPSGKIYSINNQPPEMTWHKESHYDLVTVKEPESGYWKINTKVDPDNRVMVVTDLKLITSKLPSTMYAGDEQELYIQLENEGVIIDQKDFLHFVKVKLIQEAIDENNKEKKWKLKLNDNGKGIDKKSKDGIYSIKLKKSLIAGEHEIEVSVNGTTFKRQYRKQIIIYDEPVTANIEIIENSYLKLSILPYQTIIDADSMQITATHKLPNGDKNKVKIEKNDLTEWVHEFPTKEISGKHKIIIKVVGNNKSGKTIKATLRPLTLVVDNNDSPNMDNPINPDEKPADEGTFSWAMVSLKIGTFNLFIISIFFAIYKYSSQIRQKLIPNLFEEAIDG